MSTEAPNTDSPEPSTSSMFTDVLDRINTLHAIVVEVQGDLDEARLALESEKARADKADEDAIKAEKERDEAQDKVDDLERKVAKLEDEAGGHGELVDLIEAKAIDYDHRALLAAERGEEAYAVAAAAVATELRAVLTEFDGQVRP